MYLRLAQSKKDDYFLPISKRASKGVFFCCYIGFDDEHMLFYRKFQIEAEKTGVFINSPIPNPDGAEVQDFFTSIQGDPFVLELSYIQRMVKQWLSFLKPLEQQTIADALMNQLIDLEKQSLSNHIIKNAFVKFMCWLRIPFEHTLRYLGQDQPPKILYEGDISKYELYILHILSLAGCDVLYVNFVSDASYKTIDPNASYSQQINCKRRGEPAEHFSNINLDLLEQTKQISMRSKELEQSILTNSWLTNNFMDEIKKSNTERGLLHQSKIYNLFGRCVGFDEKNEYLSRIYQWKKNLETSQKPFLMLENCIENPTPTEVKKINPIDTVTEQELITHLALQIQITNQEPLTSILRGAFIRTIECCRDTNISTLYNHGIKLLCWLQRYIPVLFDQLNSKWIPVIMYYGDCTESEAAFLNMLSSTPVDVVFLSPNIQSLTIFDRLGDVDRGIDEILPNSELVFPFPKTLPKTKVSTVAYHAEREMDQVLYTGTGLFRNKQFLRSEPTTLRTTFDEISILWNEEAKYRPNFEARNGVVVIPNIFAKICGVPNGDIPAYFQQIEGMLTNRLIFSQKVPMIPPNSSNPFTSSVHSFLDHGKLLPDVIKKHANYPFDYLNEDTQDYMLEKIQQLIELRWIQSENPLLDEKILSTLLNIDNKTIRLIQQFDFTRAIPKAIILHTDESLMSEEDCIYLLFLNLIGFDIVVFTPTGYRDLDKYISQDAYEEYQVGEYKFNVSIPPLHPQNDKNTKTKEGFFQRLFGKG